MSKIKDIFIEVHPKETWETFEVLQKTSGEIIVWTKGSDYREAYQVLSFNPKNAELALKIKLGDGTHLNKEIYLNFKVADIPYFGTGTISLDNGVYRLKIDDSVFKAEKRKSFRLMTYQDVDASIIIDNNIYRLFDISTTGLGIYLRDEESIKLFPIDKKLNNINVLLHNKTFIIEESVVLRCSKVETVESYRDKIKVGVNFTKISPEVESALFVEINSIIFEQRKLSQST